MRTPAPVLRGGLESCQTSEILSVGYISSVMALATSSLPSLCDSTMQYASPPFLSEQYGTSSHFPFVDMGLLGPLPPALLPSGLQPCYAQVEHYSRGMLQSMNTPVMHPNLVSTLKSMISPSPTSSDQSGGRAGGSEGSGDERRNGIRRTTDRFKRKHALLHQHLELPDMYSLCSSPKQSNCNSPVGEAEDDEAAVVPVDLIQNRRPFKCAYSDCNKTFKNPQTMKMHHKTHYSDDSAYTLGVNAHVLSTFKAGHNKKIPSRCPTCKKTFVGLYELRRHFGRKHSVGEKTFGCKKCGKKFYIEVDLRDHEKLCGEPIECKCGMKFAFKCNLVAHKKGHPECQDLSSGDEEQSNNNAAAQQPRRSSSRKSASVSPPIVKRGSERFSRISPPPSLTHVVSPWRPLSPSQDFAAFSGDGMSVSSDSSYHPVTSTIVTAHSSRSSPGIPRPDFLV